MDAHRNETNCIQYCRPFNLRQKDHIKVHKDILDEKARENPANHHFTHAIDELWQLAVLAGADDAEMARTTKALTTILEQRALRAARGPRN